MEYTYSFRIYPTEEQKILIAKTFGCCRFIYNYFLDYSNSNGYSSKYTNNNICNRELKAEYPWLKEVDKFAITNAIYNLDNAYKRYMNKLGSKPRFKKKNKGESYQTNYTNNNIEVLDNYIKLPKLGKVPTKVHRKVEGTIINATIKKYSNNKYNVLDIDFKDSDNEEINEINKYIKNSIPTKKNIYTGLLKDKNLIFILAESFNYMAVKKDITPSLYKLFNEGYTFDNFYNPLFPVSTADGQYLTDISLFPSDASHSLVNSNKNYIPYSLAHMFDKDGYKTFSYHNYKYDYYERDKYYPNMGFNIYKGIGNGLNMDDTRSDYDLVKSSIDEYINEDKFFTYYLTISGHAPYNKDNKMSIKNLDRLDKYDYSTNVKYYLSTQIELDNMIGLLFDRLKENNKLDDTVIVLVPDHVPYGLSIDEMNELSNEDRNDEFYKYKSNLVIYNKDINKYKSNDNYCSNIDILPTMLNLYGFDFDSRLFIGRDILSNNDGVVVFGNRNIVTKNYRYSNMKDSIYGDISNKDIDILKNEVYMKYRISRLILENNYYNYLFND